MVSQKSWDCLKKELKKELILEIGKCEGCGYNAFLSILEIAHIEHDLLHERDESKLNRNNIFLLCPTCHVAFDRGMIQVNGKWSDAKTMGKIVLEDRIKLKQAIYLQGRRHLKDTWVKKDGKFFVRQRKV